MVLKQRTEWYYKCALVGLRLRVSGSVALSFLKN